MCLVEGAAAEAAMKMSIAPSRLSCSAPLSADWWVPRSWSFLRVSDATVELVLPLRSMCALLLAAGLCGWRLRMLLRSPLAAAGDAGRLLLFSDGGCCARVATLRAKPGCSCAAFVACWTTSCGHGARHECAVAPMWKCYDHLYHSVAGKAVLFDGTPPQVVSWLRHGLWSGNRHMHIAGELSAPLQPSRGLPAGASTSG